MGRGSDRKEKPITGATRTRTSGAFAGQRRVLV
eukprot:COSAG06_NODE_16771_length_981_cov_3.421769_2_plen_32_part_01